MLAKFRTWYLTYQNEITWFIVGVLFNNFLYHLSTAQLGLALVDLVLAGINVYFWKTQNV